MTTRTPEEQALRRERIDERIRRREEGRAAFLAELARETPYLDEEAAAVYLRVARSTMQNWRTTGGGPAYRQHGGRIVYRLDDLNAWSDARRRLTTSDDDGGRAHVAP